jgi:acylaminoacyl-peptidase
VYVVQPNGATGYGQAFSGRYVNAWGKYSADDIIEGTKAFLNAYPSVDAKRVGNMGASYGGFMTMYLATKTDIFAASMSHAGISNLSSYWGHGWWGYGYSGVDCRGSFPWNNPELYVEQSPLYHADKITTPLLLIHGNADTNVPVGESHYMYTALELLGKEVELVEFNDQDHHINSRQARFDWWNTTMARFDMKLKDEPQWWHNLYPETKEQ